MKKIILPAFLLFAKIVHSQTTEKLSITDIAQTKCIYNVKYKPDSTNLNNIRSENNFLLIGKIFSIFQSENRMKIDSIISINSLHTGPKTLPPKTFFLEKIYKRIPKESITTINRMGLKEFAYVENTKDFNWKLASEKKKIKGYNCQRATTNYAGRDWEVWYTTDIPISEGPYKFSGLPGLIVQANDTRGHYFYELIAISFNNSIPITFNNTGMPYTTRSLFIKNLANFYKNYVDIRKSQGGPSYGNIEDSRRRVAENVKQRNNTLELK